MNLAKNYTNLLDEVYKQSTKSDVLTSGAEMARAGANANEIIYPQIKVSNLGDYDRSSGYVNGSVQMEWKTATFGYDRGTKLSVDAMDDEESMNIAFGKAGAELIRTVVSPEADAYTFARLAGMSGIGSASASLADGTAVLNAIISAKTAMDEAEVPSEGRILFITPTKHNAIMALDTTKSREVLGYFSQIIEVPQTRFYTAIDLLDGKSDGETAGGFKKATAGKNINFMIVEPSCVMKFDKHVANDVIPPSQNPDSDAYILKYRKYGLVDVYQNKRAGVYCHYSTT